MENKCDKQNPEKSGVQKFFGWIRGAIKKAKEVQEKSAQLITEARREKKRTEQAEIQQIADSLTTKAKYKECLRENEKLEGQILDGKFSAIDRIRAKRHMKKVDSALAIAENRGYEWQCIPDLDLCTPLELVDVAYKRITNRDERDYLENLEMYSCQVLDLEESCLERAPRGLAKYQAFMHKIALINEPKAKIETINRWIADNREISEEFQYYDGNEYYIHHLEIAGVPKPQLMIEHGYYTPEQCKTISIQGFSSWKGVGKKTVERFSAFLRGENIES